MLAKVDPNSIFERKAFHIMLETYISSNASGMREAISETARPGMWSIADISVH
jgi:hypothetical protein